MNKLVIIGAGGHGKVVADIACRLGYRDIVFLDDSSREEACGEFPVVGTCAHAACYADADFVVAIGSGAVRRALHSRLEALGCRLVTLVHPAATVAGHVTLGPGTVVMAGAVINPYAQIGEGCIVNTCASVDHDCVIGSFSHVAVGAHIAGAVTLGENTWVGAGAVIRNHVQIAGDSVIGVGAAVVKNITEPGTYIGVPAEKMEK